MTDDGLLILTRKDGTSVCIVKSSITDWHIDNEEKAFIRVGMLDGRFHAVKESSEQILAKWRNTP
jgi:hypothetical protein